MAAGAAGRAPAPRRYNLTGFNFDLEPEGAHPSVAADAPLYAAFLKEVRVPVNAAGMRLTVDAASGGWCPMIADVGLL
eukprot:gene14754-381_t